MKKTAAIICFCLLGLSLQAQRDTVTRREAIDESVFLESVIMERVGVGRNDVAHLLNRLLSLYRDQYTDKSWQYADCMMWCAMICAQVEDGYQAERLLSESIRLFRQYGQGPFDGRDTLNEILCLDVQYTLAYSRGLEYRALKLAKKSCDLKQVYFGERSEIYLQAVLDLSKLYAERLKGAKSRKYHNIGFVSYVDLIKRKFCNLSESERTLYWNTAYKYIVKTLDLAYRNKSNSSVNSMPAATFDALLLSKGLLLNTTSSFEKFVNESGNESAMRALQYKKMISEQNPDQSVLDSIDYAILKSLKEAGMEYQIPQLSIKWQQVRDRLGEDDLAVEFFKNSSDEYGAVLLKKQWKTPRLVKLKNYVRQNGKIVSLHYALQTNTMERYSEDKASDFWHISKGVWTDDILKHFPVTKEGKVYFSADGELLVTGIEYFPILNPAKKYKFEETAAHGRKLLPLLCVSDFYPMYRLSSMRELVMSDAKQVSANAAVYGGLFYDMTVDELIADAQQLTHANERELAEAQTGTKRGMRAVERGIPYLKGTATETDSIVAILETTSSGSVTDVYVGMRGTEASFKALSGRNLNILHLATHGFFYEANDPSFRRFALGNNPLVRSGLFLAGADNKWLDDYIPDDIEDGFLTSLEVANLDFQGVNLVVLSACNTAQGNVSGDGVFGLQRGFKMAGSNSLLMSLWKVDDDATCLLMTEFYKNWLKKGMSKIDALKAAKNTVRSHTEKNWDNPEFWAAFILLDGLD